MKKIILKVLIITFIVSAILGISIIFLDLWLNFCFFAGFGWETRIELWFYSDASGIFSIIIPYPFVGSLMRTWVH